MTFFLVIDHKFRTSPYFPSFSTFPPLFRDNYYPPTFTNFPPVLHKFTCFLHTLRVFGSSYFYHDAFMHHPMHYWTPLEPEKAGTRKRVPSRGFCDWEITASSEFLNHAEQKMTNDDRKCNTQPMTFCCLIALHYFAHGRWSVSSKPVWQSPRTLGRTHCRGHHD